MIAHSISFRAMGTTVNVWAEGTDAVVTELEALPAWFNDIENRLSRFRPHSDLSRLNAQAGQWVAVDDLLLNAVLASRYAAVQTEGIYNPLVLPALMRAGYDRSFEMLESNRHSVDLNETPHTTDWHQIEIDIGAKMIRLPQHAAIDLGGVGKGWLADRLAQHFFQHGSCVVDIGGDMSVRGAPASSFAWEVDIEDPFTFETLGTVRLRDAAIATSGVNSRRWIQNGQRRHHIIDPRTNQPATTDVLTATVIHSNGTLAEAYAKALVILGAVAGLRWLQQQHGTGLVVCHDGSVLATKSFTTYLTTGDLA